MYKKPCELMAISPLFSGLNHESFEPYCRQLNIRLIYKGEIVVNEGDECSSVNVVLEGQLSVQKYASNGDYVTLNLLGEGDVFGEDLIFGSSHVYPYSIEAVTNAKIISLNLSLLKQFMNENPDMVIGFLGFLSDRVQEQNERISILSQRSLRQKISSYLVSLHHKSNLPSDVGKLNGTTAGMWTSEPANPYVELPVSKEVAARLLAMPRPSFSRELVRMEKDGLIRVDGRIIWLSDLDALERGMLDGLR